MASSASSPSNGSYGLHWFRRDLRVAGNPALRWSWREHQGRVLGIFCFDAKFLGRSDFSADRFAFFLKTLQALRAELREAGGDLLVLDREPQAAFEALLGRLAACGLPAPRTISFNRDYEPFARERDGRLETFFRARGLAVHTARDHLLFEPGEIQRADGTSALFQVYSPFAKRWFEALSKSRERVDDQREGLAWMEARASGKATPKLFALTWPQLFQGQAGPVDELDAYAESNAARVRVPIPEAGSVAGWRRLRDFQSSLARYKTERDFPALGATSRVSPFLKNGSLTTAQIVAALGLASHPFGEGTGSSTYLRELAWREFYYQVLWFRPSVEREAFLPAYRDLRWENREDWFLAWKEGRTGYALVDAGMRELAATGFMHNRVRMVVASFLTKDLLVDWRWGERHFMERLLDGDLAPNNGGWQWAASTGCDPQPYFRVFNPTLQSERFDPTGVYLKRWLPERRGLSGKALHAPLAPIVEHAVQKEKAVALFRASGLTPSARAAKAAGDEDDG